MLRWTIDWIIWISWRIIVTLLCVASIQNVIHREGYLIDFNVLLVGAILLIVGVRIWMPSGSKGV
jgi:hypothetical protein